MSDADTAPRKTVKKVVRRKKRAPATDGALAPPPLPSPRGMAGGGPPPPPPPPPPFPGIPTFQIVSPPTPNAPPISVDPARRARALDKIAASAGVVVDRDVFLQSIRTGIRLRPVPVVRDASGLILEGAVLPAASISRPESPCSILSVGESSAASGYWSENETASTSIRSSIRSTGQPLDGSPIIADPARRTAILQKLAAQAANPQHVDRDALLRSIHAGVQLRKTETRQRNDRSGLVVDDDMMRELRAVVRPETPNSLASAGDTNSWRSKSPTPSAAGCNTPPAPTDPPAPPPIAADPARRAAILEKMAAQTTSPARVDRGALLRSIQQGVQLRRTVVNEHKKLDVDSDAGVGRPATPCSLSSLDSQGMSSSYTPSSGASSSCDDYSARLTFSKSATPQAVPPPSLALPGDAPIERDPRRRELILNKFATLAASGQRIDRDALLKSIRDGVKLRSIKTNDRSGPFISDDNSGRPVNQQPVRVSVPASSALSQECSRPTLTQLLRPTADPALSRPKAHSVVVEPPAESKKSDFYFEERNLHVTREDIDAEVPVGSARAKIAALRDIEAAAAAGPITGKSKSVSPAPRHFDVGSGRLKGIASQFEAKDESSQSSSRESKQSSDGVTASSRQRLSVSAAHDTPAPPAPPTRPPPLKAAGATRYLLTLDASAALAAPPSMRAASLTPDSAIGAKSNVEKLRRSFVEKSSDDRPQSASSQNLSAAATRRRV